METITISIRNYPLPFCKLDDVRIDGSAVIIQPKDDDISTLGPLRQFKFDKDDHIYQLRTPQHVPRIYYDLDGDITRNDFIVGVSYLPSFEDIAIAFERLSPKKSVYMYWWDTLRIMTHGRYTAVIRNSRLRLLCGINPYE